MFNLSKKQFAVIRRVLFSVVGTLSVLIIVTASILFMLGYRLDSGNGHLEQGALLQFDSKPSGADVTVDGKSINGQTATKQTVIAGVHSVKISKNGYEDWTRTLSLDAGTLTWLDYVRLVPKTRTVEAVASYTKLAGLSFSPDLKWALAIQEPSLAIFQQIDLRSETVKVSTLTLPATLYAAPATGSAVFSIYKWNSNGRYVIIHHTYGEGQTEWLMVDTQDVTKSVNITRLLSVGFSDIQFAGTSGTSLYGLTTDGLVRKLDLSAATISRALVTNVSSFSVFEDDNIVSYVGMNPADTTKKVAGIYKDGESGPTILRTATDSNSALNIALGRYFSDDYVAISEGNAVNILTGTLPSAGSTDTDGLSLYGMLRLSGSVDTLSFSKEGDFVVAQADSEFKSYEIEHQRSSVGAVATSGDKPATTLKWLDLAHLWNDDNNALIMRDFDGTNAHTIMTVETGFGASLSTNGKFFYGVGKTDSGYQLQRVRMIL